MSTSVDTMQPATNGSDPGQVKVKLREQQHSGKERRRPMSVVSETSVKTYCETANTFDFANQTIVLGDGSRESCIIEDPSVTDNIRATITSMYDVFKRGVNAAGDAPCLGWKPTSDTPYKWMSYNEFDKRSTDFGNGLLSLGVEAGNDTRVGIYSQNRPEYQITCFGLMKHSITEVPLYDTLGLEAGNFIINQTQLQAIICDNNGKLKGLLDRHADLPSVNLLVVMETPSRENQDLATKCGVRLEQYQEVEKLGQENPHSETTPKPEDICIICYTSGTTGTPKGAMISHKNLASVVPALDTYLEMSQSVITNEDVLISYLPLAHVYERVMEGGVIGAGGRIGYFQGDVKKLLDDIKELKPTIFPSVPRLLNRIYDKISSGVNASRIKKLLFSVAMYFKEKDVKKGVVRNNSVWDKLVFSKAQAALGGRCRLIVTASAPISANVLSFLKCIFGCAICEAYGQTENTGAATSTLIGDPECGHVGTPLPGGQIKLVDIPEMDYYSKDNKGEVCIKGDNVFNGYFKEPEKTREALDEDGWLHTGDVGEWTSFGALKIIDRKKNIFKLAQGEYIAPEKVENVLVQSTYLAQIYVHGDSLQHCLVGVAVLDPESIDAISSKLGIQGSMEELCQNKVLKDALLKDLSEIGAAKGLSSLEKVKDIYIHPELFSVENNLLTPTFKTKRNEASKFFAPQIQEMYSNLTSATNPTSPTVG